MTPSFSAAFSAAAGEDRDGQRAFKLVVEGSAGNDGNLFDVSLSLRDTRLLPVPDARMFTYSPTLRVPPAGEVVEMRLSLPERATGLVVHTFDAAAATMRWGEGNPHGAILVIT